LEQSRLPGSVFQVLLVIMDFTIGYQRDQAAISLTKFQNKTHLPRQSVVNAIKDAERREIISVQRRGTSPKEGTAYAINPVLASWAVQKSLRTRQVGLTSKLVKPTLPDWSSPRDQTSQVLTSATPTERNLKETLKKENGGTELTFSNPLNPPSLGDLTPPPPFHRRTASEERLLEYLRQSSQPCRIRELARALGFPYGSTQIYLTRLKKAGLAVNAERGRWISVNGAEDDGKQ